MRKLWMTFCSLAFLAGIFLGSGTALANHGDEDKNCDDFANKQEVMEFWDSHGYDENNDPSDLDRDSDNLPCETTQGDWDDYNASKDTSDSDSEDSEDNESAAGSSDDGDGTSADEGGELPNTATSNPLMMLMGVLLLGTGGLLFIRKRKLN
ncbi:LPXTG cell wall anchor domain-containing protein [Halobacillus massiliensis]|uniref:LPXTG cell wall anchor domain-containing protein n=1 Tax=Halobacillus massiliensis TaxID=1926286 RepID=UPI0009E3C400|nr:LPXTG cell wall anchor domain-containing protein [Halobacillus massiliensis]